MGGEEGGPKARERAHTLVRTRPSPMGTWLLFTNLAMKMPPMALRL